MPQQLTTLNATITTATIEVCALTLGRKQVTQSVFRQLIVEDVLHELDATIEGNPWGFVNYHPDKCCDDSEHLHVVWQKGDELRRTTVQAPYAGRHAHLAADLYVQARIIHRTIHNPYAEPRPGDVLRLGEAIPGGWHHFNSGRFRHDGVAFEGTIPTRLRSAWRNDRKLNAEDRAAFEENAYCLGVPDAASDDSAAEQFLSMLPTRQYRESWTALAALPQLFIAV